MKFIIPMLIILLIFPVPASAAEITAPTVPNSAVSQMPEEATSFGESLMELLQKAFLSIRPDIKSTLQVCVSLIATVMATRILQDFSSGVTLTAELAGTACVAASLLMNVNSMIQLGSDTITEMTEYGKLLFPVMTAALASQGGITTSASLYAGTMAFVSLLTSLLSSFLLPLVSVYLALAIASSALPEAFLAKMKNLVKQLVSWCLKTLLTVFTTYLSVTGVVSGTTDAATLKATKVTISTFVPVVGGILSDASESVLVSAALAKNAAGIYGLLAIFALFLAPFLRIGLHYGMLKITAAICELVGPKHLSALVEDFSIAMGLILGMTGSVCLLLLISTVCFLKGAG